MVRKMAVNFIWPAFLYYFRIRICKNKPCLPVFRISLFLVHVLAIFLCIVCYPDDRCSKIPCRKRKKSPGATLRASTELCPLSLQQYSHEKSGNWRHYSFRLFGVSFLHHSSFLTSGFVSTDWHQLCWKRAPHLRRPSHGPHASRADLRSAQARVWEGQEDRGDRSSADGVAAVVTGPSRVFAKSIMQLLKRMSTRNEVAWENA